MPINVPVARGEWYNILQPNFSSPYYEKMVYIRCNTKLSKVTVLVLVDFSNAFNGVVHDWWY